MTDSMPDRDIRRDLLKHHWEHARWLQNTRNTFFYMYIIVFAGAVSLTPRETSALKIVLLFLLLFSVITIIFGVKNGMEFYHHASYAIFIAESLNAEDWMSKPLGMYKNDVADPGFLNPFEFARKLSELPMHTSPFLSPGNWALLLSITGFGLTLGWTIFEYTAKLTISSLIAIFSILFLIPIIWCYLNVRIKRIDLHIKGLQEGWKNSQ